MGIFILHVCGYIHVYVPCLLFLLVEGIRHCFFICVLVSVTIDTGFVCMCVFIDNFVHHMMHLVGIFYG